MSTWRCDKEAILKDISNVNESNVHKFKQKTTINIKAKNNKSYEQREANINIDFEIKQQV